MAQVTSAAKPTSWDVSKAILLVVGIGIAAAVVLGAAAMYLRRRALEAQAGGGVSVFGELDEMLRRGQISADEHRAMRRSIAAKAAQKMDERREARARAASPDERSILRAAGLDSAPVTPAPARKRPPPPPADTGPAPDTPPPASPPGYDAPGAGPTSR